MKTHDADYTDATGRLFGCNPEVGDIIENIMPFENLPHVGDTIDFADFDGGYWQTKVVSSNPSLGTYSVKVIWRKERDK